MSIYPIEVGPVSYALDWPYPHPPDIGTVQTVMDVTRQDPGHWLRAATQPYARALAPGQPAYLHPLPGTVYDALRARQALAAGSQPYGISTPLPPASDWAPGSTDFVAHSLFDFGDGGFAPSGLSAGGGPFSAYAGPAGHTPAATAGVFGAAPTGQAKGKAKPVAASGSNLAAWQNAGILHRLQGDPFFHALTADSQRLYLNELFQNHPQLKGASQAVRNQLTRWLIGRPGANSRPDPQFTPHLLTLMARTNMTPRDYRELYASEAASSRRSGSGAGSGPARQAGPRNDPLAPVYRKYNLTAPQVTHYLDSVRNTQRFQDLLWDIKPYEPQYREAHLTDPTLPPIYRAALLQEAFRLAGWGIHGFGQKRGPISQRLQQSILTAAGPQIDQGNLIPASPVAAGTTPSGLTGFLPDRSPQGRRNAAQQDRQARAALDIMAEKLAKEHQAARQRRDRQAGSLNRVINWIDDQMGDIAAGNALARMTASDAENALLDRLSKLPQSERIQFESPDFWSNVVSQAGAEAAANQKGIPGSMARFGMGVLTPGNASVMKAAKLLGLATKGYPAATRLLNLGMAGYFGPQAATAIHQSWSDRQRRQEDPWGYFGDNALNLGTGAATLFGAGRDLYDLSGDIAAGRTAGARSAPSANASEGEQGGRQGRRAGAARPSVPVRASVSAPVGRAGQPARRGAGPAASPASGPVNAAGRSRQGRSKEDAQDGPMPVPDYSHLKVGPDRLTLGMPDLEQFMGENGLLNVYPIYGDRVMNGMYSNPTTGASVRLFGGPRYGASDEFFGKAAWASTEGRTATSKIRNRARDSRGVGLVVLQDKEANLSSQHGPMVYQAELQNAVKQGKIKERVVVRGLNTLLTQYGLSPIKNLSELTQSTKRLTYPQRKALVKAISTVPMFANIGVPHWEDAMHLMSEPEYRDLPNYSIVSALHLDPDNAAPVRFNDIGVPEHPSYGDIHRGIYLGDFAQPLPVGEVFQEFIDNYLAREQPRYERGDRTTQPTEGRALKSLYRKTPITTLDRATLQKHLGIKGANDYEQSTQNDPGRVGPDSGTDRPNLSKVPGGEHREGKTTGARAGAIRPGVSPTDAASKGQNPAGRATGQGRRQRASGSLNSLWLPAKSASSEDFSLDWPSLLLQALSQMAAQSKPPHSR